MGHLDEAIRAHLELKRKHGASEEELHAEEQEALGPVRRDPPGRPPPEAEAPAGDAPETAWEAEEPADFGARPRPGAALEDPVFADAPAMADAPTDPEPEVLHEPSDSLTEPAAEPPAGMAEPSAGTFDPPETVDSAGGAPSSPQPSPPEAGEPQPGDTPPRGFDAVEDATREDGEEGEDVLEETPEFLQETPEHDRLWFEQKPPRDFDFDE